MANTLEELSIEAKTIKWTRLPNGHQKASYKGHDLIISSDAPNSFNGKLDGKTVVFSQLTFNWCLEDLIDQIS